MPATATFDKNAEGANYADVVLTATSGTGATVSKLFIGDVEVSKNSGTNWSLSSGTITIKKAYLSTLEVGDTVFVVKFTADNDCTVKVTVEDTTTPVEG